jgi:hypothetical protein
MKDPRKMTMQELIDLADEIKKGMTKKFLADAKKLEKSRYHRE